MGHDLSQERAAADAATRSFALAESDPRLALDLADSAESLLAGYPTDTAVKGKLGHARGLALRALGETSQAAAALRVAVTDLEDAGDRAGAARARTSLALDAFHLGQLEEALALLDDAERDLDRAGGAKAAMQRAVVLQRAGRTQDALAAFDRAIETFRTLGLRGPEGKALGNRGLVHAYRGNFAAAETDLLAAREHFEADGDAALAIAALHDLGFIAARQGDLPRALRLFDEAQQQSARLGATPTAMLSDRVQTLLDAGLAKEGRDVIETALERLEAMGDAADLAEACLLAARACELDGDPAAARRYATRAAELFDAQGRARWRPLADLAAMRARLAQRRGGARTDHPTPRERGEARALALEAEAISSALEAQGWLTAALEAAARAVELASEAGDLHSAAGLLDRVRRMRRRAPSAGRLDSWIAEATYRWRANDLRGARRALEAARRAFEDHRSTLGSLELRARAAERAERLVALGVRIAVSDGRPELAMGWMEVTRGLERAALARPENDAGMSESLEALRRVTAVQESQAHTPREAQRLRRQQAVLEEVVRRFSRHVGLGAVPIATRFDPPAAARAAGERLLVEYGIDGDRLFAVSVRRGDWRVEPVASLAEIHKDVSALRLALRHWALGGEGANGLRALTTAAQVLEDRLLGPLSLWRLSEAPPPGLVLAPSGAVASVPWGALPTAGRREVLVVPSISQWSLAPFRPLPPAPRVAVLVGPGLAFAQAEASAIAAIWGDRVTILDGKSASAAGLIEALERADIVHVAAHGTYRGDNPLLSSVRVADGSLTGYDLGRVRASARLVVLSACDAGAAADARDGSYGLADILLATGIGTVVASVSPVGDERSSLLMSSFHGYLRDGCHPATALARGRVALGQGSDGFVCFGLDALE